MYVCVCMYVPGKLEKLLADFDAVTKVTWAKHFFSKVKIPPKKDEKHHFCDALTS